MRGGGLLFVIVGAYTVVVLGGELSAAATFAGALIRVATAFVDTRAISELGQVQYALVFVVVLGVVLGVQ